MKNVSGLTKKTVNDKILLTLLCKGKDKMGIFDRLKNKGKNEEPILEEETKTEGSQGNEEFEEPLKNTVNIDNQLRFLIEQKILPAKLYDDPIFVITSIIGDKGRYLNNFYRVIYAQQKKDCPYTDEDFKVSLPFEVEGAKAIKIDMPEVNLNPSLCKSVYIVYNDRFTKSLYVTVELLQNGSYQMCTCINAENEVYSKILDDDEKKLLAEIVKDEQIAEEKYSDVFEKLMEKAEAPEDLLTEAVEIQKYSAAFMNALMKVQKLKQENKREEAVKLLRAIIRKEAPKYENTSDREYHCFHNMFEVLLYANFYHPYNPVTDKKKELVAMQVDLSSAYLILGVMMLEQNQFDSAIEILSKAVEANPVNVQLLFALADAYKGKRFLNTYMSLMKRAHVCAVRKVDIARIYRNYAYYYTQIKDYELAANLAYASKYFDTNEQLFKNCLKYVTDNAGTEFLETEIDELKKKLFMNGIIWGVKELVVSVVKMLEQQYTQTNNEQGLKMCENLKKEFEY